MKNILFLLLVIFIMGCDQNDTNNANIVSDKKASLKENKICSKQKVLDKKNKFLVDYNYPFLNIFYKDKILKKFILPSSEEVKNIEYKNIDETKDGFDIVFEWGGFKFGHFNTFVFTKSNDSFYLTKIKTKIFINELDKIKNDSILIVPKQRINNISLKDEYRKYKNL